MLKNLSKIFFYAFVVTAHSLSAEEICTLQPQDSADEKEFIDTFEKNIEEKMSEIYQNVYFDLFNLVKQVELLKEELKDFEQMMIKKSLKPLHRHPKNPSLYKKKVRQREALFLNLIAKEVYTKDQWQALLKTASFVHPLPFEVYQEYHVRQKTLKLSIEDTNKKIHPMKAVHFLYPPKWDYSLRGGGISYGNLQLEAFMRPPLNNLFKLPYLNIGFETNTNTVIYVCAHLSAFDPSENVFYFYFLNMTKLHQAEWRKLLFSPKEAVRALVNMRRPPQAIITPLPFVLNPLSSAFDSIGILGNAAERLPLADSLSTSSEQLTRTFSRFNVLDFTANLNPIAKIALDQVDFGVKALEIRPEKLSISYSASALYGLITIDIAKQGQKGDFSSVMNVMTWQKL